MGKEIVIYHSAAEPQAKESEYLPQRAAKERKCRRVRSAHDFVALAEIRFFGCNIFAS
jgi:hypothetical protein